MASYKHGDIADIDFHYAHTSGHATVEDLQKFAAAFKPKMLVPIHTEFSGKYKEFFDNVVEIEDGKSFEL